MIRYILPTAVIALVLDLLTKWYVFDVMAFSQPVIEVLPFFNLVHVYNTGISFGLFSGNPYGQYIFSGLSIIIVGILLWWGRNIATPLGLIAVGLISGGAVGNIIDRIRLGAVADFLDFHILGYHWPAFNIADSAIVIGAILLLIDGMRTHHE